MAISNRYIMIKLIFKIVIKFLHVNFLNVIFICELTLVKFCIRVFILACGTFFVARSFNFFGFSRLFCTVDSLRPVCIFGFNPVKSLRIIINPFFKKGLSSFEPIPPIFILSLPSFIV